MGRCWVLRRKVLFFVSIIGVITLVIYIVLLLNQDFALTREDNSKKTLNIWTTTPRLSHVLHQFEVQSDVKIKLKRFRDNESVMEGLKLALEEKQLPDLVELNSHTGIEEILKDYNLISMSEFSPELPEMFHQSIVDNFSVNDNLYAYPLGIEIPLMLINQSFINDEVDMHMYPFSNDEQLMIYQAFQDKVNEYSNNDFWLFHFDENIPWYWASNQLSKGANVNISEFWDAWYQVTGQYKIVPKLDHRMALTRFTNMEVGILVTSSNNLQTIQQSIGNNFEFMTSPFLSQENSHILVSGTGLVALNNNIEIMNLFNYLNEEDTQKNLLSKTGMLPSRNDLLEDKVFIQNLPMSKHLTNLIEYKEQFIGLRPEKDNISWGIIMEQVQDIELD